ncbi:MAG: Ig-like domain repeat protein, partial [Chloroflexi bacterium]|nr:Ig-like domain repeat protein [Chloroflexota bacterium]
MKTNLTKKSFAVVLITLLLLVALPVTTVFAATTAQLNPTGTGYIAQWAGSSTSINEGIASATCTGAGNYLTTITSGYRSAFTIDLSSIPNGSTITSVNVLVADRGDNSAGGTYSTFIRLNGTNSSDSASHSVTGTNGACTGFPNDAFTVTPTVKNAGTTLEIGVVKGNTTNLRIGTMAAIVTYTPAITATTTTVASNLNPSTYGSSVTFTATVSPTPTNGVTVEFYDGATLLGTGTTSAGQATYATAALTASGAGTHSITAKFLGNASFGASTSSAITQTVNKKTASVTPNTASKTYGDSDPAFSGSLSGFLAGDNVTATYSRAAGETVAGGPYTISATLDPAGVLGNYNITYNTANFTIDQKAASVTPNAASKTYGDSDPTLTGTLSGFLAGDNVTATYSRTAGETVAGGPYTISATLDPAGVLGNYNITYNTANFTIDQKTASVTPDALSKTYGDSDPTLTGTLSGFLAGDNVTATYSRTAGETVAGGPYTISATLDPAGVLGNYNITYNTANFTIDQKAASVTPNAASKTYGDADPALSGSLSGFLAGDNVTATYSRVAGEDASTYTISATLDPAGVLGNYNITYNTAVFTINKKALTVTANNNSKTYDKVAYSGGNGVVFSGFIPGEDESFLGGALAYSGSSQGAVNAGAYDITPGGLTSSNYEISFVDGVLTINQVDLAITAQHDERVYNGNASSSVAPQITSGGLVSGDSASLVQSFDDKNVGSGKTLSAAASTISDGNSGQNYNVTFVDDTTGAITAYDLEVTAASDSKEYDGSTLSGGAPTITGGQLFSGDTATWSQTFDNKNVGTGKTLTPAGAIDDGNGGLNYNITFVPVSTGSITARAITVTAVTDTKEYDGDNGSNATPQVTGGGLATGDIASFSQLFDDKNVGTGKTLTPSGSVNDGNNGDNYVVTFVDDTTGEITVRAIEVTAATDTKTYDGTNASNGTPSITSGSLATGDTATWTQSFDDQNTGSKTLTPAGSINDGNGGLNYSITFVPVSGTIDAATLDVTANNKTIHFGGTEPAFDYAVSGFIAPDDFLTAPTCAVVENPHTAVGTYTIACSGGDAGLNYSIAYHDGVFTITDKVILTVTASSASITYGDADPAITASYAGFVDGDTVAVIDTPATCSVTGPLTAVGSPFASSCSGAADDKYDFTYVNGSVAVGQKALSITASNGSKTYGDTKTFTGSEFTASGLVGSDSVASVTLASSGAPATAAVGPYAITASGATGTGLGNYAITYHDGSLTVAAKALSITASNGTKTYGDTKTFAGTEFTANGLVNSDTVTSVTLTSSGSVATANVGTYNIVPTNA